MEDLFQRKRALEQEIAALKAEGIASIRQQMADLGITVEDLVETKRVNAPKYTDGNGNFWSGVGARPNWLRAALIGGATIEQFVIKR